MSLPLITTQTLQQLRERPKIQRISERKVQMINM